MVFLWQRFYIQYAKEVFFCKANIWLHVKKDSVILKKIGQTSECKNFFKHVSGTGFGCRISQEE